MDDILDPSSLDDIGPRGTFGPTPKQPCEDGQLINLLIRGGIPQETAHNLAKNYPFEPLESLKLLGTNPSYCLSLKNVASLVSVRGRPYYYTPPLSQLESVCIDALAQYFKVDRTGFVMEMDKCFKAAHYRLWNVGGLGDTEFGEALALEVRNILNSILKENLKENRSDIRECQSIMELAGKRVLWGVNALVREASALIERLERHIGQVKVQVAQLGAMSDPRVRAHLTRCGDTLSTLKEVHDRLKNPLLRIDSGRLVGWAIDKLADIRHTWEDYLLPSEGMPEKKGMSNKLLLISLSWLLLVQPGALEWTEKQGFKFFKLKPALKRAGLPERHISNLSDLHIDPRLIPELVARFDLDQIDFDLLEQYNKAFLGPCRGSLLKDTPLEPHRVPFCAFVLASNGISPAVANEYWNKLNGKADIMDITDAVLSRTPIAEIEKYYAAFNGITDKNFTPTFRHIYACMRAGLTPEKIRDEVKAYQAIFNKMPQSEIEKILEPKKFPNIAPNVMNLIIRGIPAEWAKPRIRNKEMLSNMIPAHIKENLTKEELERIRANYNIGDDLLYRFSVDRLKELLKCLDRAYKPNAIRRVFILSEDDWSGAFSNDPLTFANGECRDLIFVAKNEWDISNACLDLKLRGISVDVMVIAGHGSGGSIQLGPDFGEGCYLDLSDTDIFEQILERMAKAPDQRTARPVVVLAACSTGLQLAEGIANTSKEEGILVIGPRAPTLPPQPSAADVFVFTSCGTVRYKSK